MYLNLTTIKDIKFKIKWGIIFNYSPKWEYYKIGKLNDFFQIGNVKKQKIDNNASYYINLSLWDVKKNRKYFIIFYSIIFYSVFRC